MMTLDHISGVLKMLIQTISSNRPRFFVLFLCGVWFVDILGQGDVTLRKVANRELLMVRGTICFQKM